MTFFQAMKGTPFYEMRIRGKFATLNKAIIANYLNVSRKKIETQNTCFGKRCASLVDNQIEKHFILEVIDWLKIVIQYVL